MRHVNYTDFRQNLASHMDRVWDDRDPLHVSRRGGRSVVVMSEADYSSLMETMYLMSNPANAAALLSSIADSEAGRVFERDLIEPASAE